jgi:hypothetical protein
MYVAGSACAAAVAVDGAMDCVDDDGMTGHAEVIVCSPDTNSFICIFCMSIWEFARKLK